MYGRNARTTRSSVVGHRRAVADGGARGLLPPIAAFLEKHPEFGPGTNPLPKATWLAGDRQTADAARGPVEFYVQDGEVVTVWQASDRAKLWEKPGYTAPSAQDKTPKSVNASSGLPKYTIIETVKLMGGGKHGDVLVPTYSKKTPVAEREALLQHVMKAEGFTEASLYCSKDAQKADSSEKFAKSHPRARDCSLGLVSLDTRGKLLD